MSYRKIRQPILGFVILMAVIYSASANAAKVEISEKSFLEFHGYIQTWLNVSLDNEEDKPDVISDFYLRRVRLLAKGQLGSYFNFFIGTLNLDMGKGGDFSGRTTIGDAWMEAVVAKELKVDVGLLKLPFSRHGGQGGGTLHGIDFHGTFLKSGVSFSQRDVGVMARGLLFNELIDYRIAILDGVEPGGEDDLPRFMGRLGINIFDSEPAFFFKGTHLGKKKVLSFGLTFDLQPGVGGDDGKSLLYSFAFDGFLDLPLGDNGLIATINAYLYGPGGAVPEGIGLWADLGFRIRAVEPLVALEWFAPSDGDTGKRLSVLGGVNWWMDGHRSNLKLQFGGTKIDGSSDWSKTFVLQGQIFY